jgi:hypothetical protein
MKRVVIVLIIGACMGFYNFITWYLWHSYFLQHCMIPFSHQCQLLPHTYFKFLDDLWIPVPFFQVGGIIALIIGIISFISDRRNKTKNEPTVDTMKKSGDVLSS